MKIILKEDVNNLGFIGDIVTVADGYARNFLLPKGLAVTASQGATMTIESQVQAQQQKQARAETQLAELAKKLNGLEITIAAKAGTKEKLYGQVTAAEIAAEIERATGIALDKRKIELEGPIRRLGSYEARVKLSNELISKVKVNVKAMEAT